MIRVGSGSHTYEWIDGWADVPDTEAASSGWAHHGVAVTSRNTVIAGHPARAELLEFDASGQLVSQARTELTECHGITLVTEGGTDIPMGRRHWQEAQVRADRTAGSQAWAGGQVDDEDRAGPPPGLRRDRANNRVQVYDLEGTFKRSFGEDFLIMPTGFGISGDDLILIELRARATVVDGNDGLIGYLGTNLEVCDSEGWPNAKDAQGEPIRSPRLEVGKFNSPHGMAVDGDGNIYVSEWLIGGRYTKLARLAG